MLAAAMLSSARSLLLALLSLLTLLALASEPGAQKELLRDGDFEKSGKASSPGWTHIWPPDFRPAPVFSFPDEGARAGKRCGQIAVAYEGGYSSFTQELDLPRKTDWVRFTGAVQVVESSGGGSAWLILTFIKKDSSDFDLRQSRRVRTPGEWEELAIEAAVPEGTTRLLVRGGVFGPARVRFDDLSLLAGAGERPREDVTLLTVESRWKVRAEGSPSAPWVDVSVPFPFAAQAPLALRVDSEPAGAVRGLAVVAERENRPLRVQLAPLAAGAEVSLRVRTLVLVRRRTLADGKDAELALASRVPESLREFLRPAAGIESDDERILRIAKGFGRGDLAEITADLLAFLKREIAGGSGDQGALATLTRGDAACTGHANLAAALLIAAGVPTRVLACVLVGADQQEHYVVESWTKALGWARVEPTVKLFPVPDALHAILRVVYPDAPRSPGSVPLFWRAADGLAFDPEMGRLEKPTCFQSAAETGQLALERDGLEACDAAAREAFEALVQTGAERAWIRLAPAATPAELLRAIDAFLAP